MADTRQYTLYVKDTCPYCQKVLKFMDDHHIVLPLVNLTQFPYQQGYDDLINLGGRYQVPCLSIDGKAMYESDDIIAYLKKTFVDA